MMVMKLEVAVEGNLYDGMQMIQLPYMMIDEMMLELMYKWVVGKLVVDVTIVTVVGEMNW